MAKANRREFLRTATAAAAAASFGTGALNSPQSVAASSADGMQFGLVTYLWGKDMDLPTLLDACEKSGLPAVELRTRP